MECRHPLPAPSFQVVYKHNTARRPIDIRGDRRAISVEDARTVCVEVVVGGGVLRDVVRDEEEVFNVV